MVFLFSELLMKMKIENNNGKGAKIIRIIETQSKMVSTTATHPIMKLVFDEESRCRFAE